MKDDIYRDKRVNVADFAFDESVTAVFPDMIRRSVPGYDNVVSISGLIAAERISANTACYDLGCSRGATTLAILRSLDDRPCTLHAVDSSEAMIAEARRHVEDARVRFHVDDIRTCAIDNASAVVLNYTLQFVAPDERVAVLQRIRDGLVSGGIIVLSEKVRDTDEFERLHLQFKRENGYSEMEISQKRSALEQVMQIDTLETHLNRLEQTGFANPRVWFKCLNWVSIAADA